MELKGFKTVSHKERDEFLNAVEDLQKGKRNAAKRLYICVEKGIITSKDYDELIEQFATKKEKAKKKHDIYLFGRPIKEYLPILFFFSIIGAIYVIIDAIEENNYLAKFAFLYLGCCFGLYYYSKTN